MLANEIMYKALVDKDSSFKGTFIAGVKTTGIFCRPTCTAGTDYFVAQNFNPMENRQLPKNVNLIVLHLLISQRFPFLRLTTVHFCHKL